MRDIIFGNSGDRELATKLPVIHECGCSIYSAISQTVEQKFARWSGYVDNTHQYMFTSGCSYFGRSG